MTSASGWVADGAGPPTGVAAIATKIKAVKSQWLGFFVLRVFIRECILPFLSFL
jgi:hypothetical protein